MFISSVLYNKNIFFFGLSLFPEFVSTCHRILNACQLTFPFWWCFYQIYCESLHTVSERDFPLFLFPFLLFPFCCCYFILLVVLRIEPEALPMLGKYCNPELRSPAPRFLRQSGLEPVTLLLLPPKYLSPGITDVSGFSCLIEI